MVDLAAIQNGNRDGAAREMKMKLPTDEPPSHGRASGGVGEAQIGLRAEGLRLQHAVYRLIGRLGFHSPVSIPVVTCESN